MGKQSKGAPPTPVNDDEEWGDEYDTSPVKEADTQYPIATPPMRKRIRTERTEQHGEDGVPPIDPS